MSDERERDEKGVSARQLALVFLAGVAVCAVFFSLGFLVGYNERSSAALPTERVTEAPLTPRPFSPPPAATPEAKTPGEATTLVTGRSGPPEPLAAVSAPDSRLSAPPTSPATGARSAETPAKAVLPDRPGDLVQAGFTVQVAALRTRQDAERLLKELKARGYAVFVVMPEYTRADDNLFRVQVGPFASRDEAEKVRVKLASDGFRPYIRQ